MSLKLALNFSRSDSQPIDADYIVTSGVANKSDIPTYIQNLDIAHSGMQLYFTDLDLGVIVIDKPTGEYVELGGGGIELVADSTEESEVVSSLTPSDQGQLIYNQTDDQFKKWDGSSLIESSGQIITEVERNRLVPDVYWVQLADLSSVKINGKDYLELDLADPTVSASELNDFFGRILVFDNNTISGDEAFLITLPDSNTTTSPGYHLFFISNGSERAIFIRSESNDTMLPTPVVELVHEYMGSVYNIEDDTNNNLWSASGNIFQGSL